MKNHCTSMNCLGFTLLEIIITLVLFSIFSTMVIPYFLSGAMSSATPIERLQSSALLNSAMSSVVSDYYSLDNSSFKIRASDFSKYYTAICADCSAVIEYPTNLGLIKQPMKLTIKNSKTNESIAHVFTF